MAAMTQAPGMDRDTAGRWQPISNRAAGFGAGRAGAGYTDFWRDRSD